MMHFIELSVIFCLLPVFSFALPNDEIQYKQDEKDQLDMLNDDDGIDSLDLNDGYNEEIEYFHLNDTKYNADSANNGTNANATVQVTCLRNKTLEAQPVEIVNSTRLASILQSEANVTSRQAPAPCIAVFFYSATCPFSCHAAPYFNALAKHFPDIKMVALDAMAYKNFNAQYGVFGVPTLIIYHNGRLAARLNDTYDYNLETFAKFIKSSTNLEPFGKLVVTSNDFIGPISPVPVYEKDYYLVVSWTVIALQLLYSFYCSSWGRWLVDATLSAWREAEAQHHHID